jgi:hypothetical protein
VTPGALRAAALHDQLSSHDIASRYITSSMTREGLELFEELMRDRAAISSSR